MDTNLPAKCESGGAERGGFQSAKVACSNPSGFLSGHQPSDGRRDAERPAGGRQTAAHKHSATSTRNTSHRCVAASALSGGMRAVGAARFYYYEARLVVHRRGGGSGGGAAHLRRTVWTSLLDETKQRLE